jgi:hypothetical protein
MINADGNVSKQVDIVIYGATYNSIPYEIGELGLSGRVCVLSD